MPEKVTFAFRETLLREPLPTEVDRIVVLHESALFDYQKVAEMAGKIAQEPLGALPKESDLADYAAWTVVSNVLLNLDEVFLKR
jgi:hypothetical protein